MTAGRLAIFYLTLLSLCLFHCTDNRVSGGGTEDVNTITVTGVLSHEDGSPAEGAEVTLYSRDYNPTLKQDDSQTAKVTETDEQGVFAFGKVTTGLYNVGAVHPDDRTMALVQDVEILENQETPVEADAQLKEPGAVAISFRGWTVKPGAFIYIPGTSVYGQINAQNIEREVLTLVPVPAAKYSGLKYMEDGTVSDVNAAADGFEVKPGATDSVGEFPVDTVVTGFILAGQGRAAAGAVVPCRFPHGHYQRGRGVRVSLRVGRNLSHRGIRH
jgi:protocatechuate 3,4-dioxygenase beta subunit